MRKFTKKTPLFISSVVMVCAFGLIYSCSKNERSNEASPIHNQEKVLYERPVKDQTTLDTSKFIKLDSRLKTTSLINYENDLLSDLKANSSWEEYLSREKYVLDKEHIKKSTIDGTSILLLSIPFEKNEQSGFLNVYKLENRYFWTVTTIKSLPNGYIKYSITSKNGKPIMQLQLDRSNKIYNFTAAKNDDLDHDYSLLKGSDVSTLSVTPEEAAPTNCFAKDVSYYNCLTCIIVTHCGQDLACTVACGAFIEVCLGISVLACLP